MVKNKLTLALQGGGSHGAFTWGVLEKLFEEDKFNITAICGTSAGAINAGIAVYGYHKGGNKGAIELLNEFWERLSAEALTSPLQPSLLDKVLSAGNMDFSPGYNMANLMSNYLSPYQWNPFDINPLKDILNELIDFKALRDSDETEMKLFTCATNVKTGQPKIFKRKHVTVDTLLASACLPLSYKAVEVDGEYYWDGGFMGNPPLYPLIHGTDTSDILLVQLNPCRIKKVPKKADSILHRINELSFNASLIGELRLVEFKNALLENDIIKKEILANKELCRKYNKHGQLRSIRYHAILADEALAEFDVSSKSNISWDFINLLKESGRKYAEDWLNTDAEKVGKETTADYFSRELEHEDLGFDVKVKSRK
jgi:NTE family protein